MTSHDVHGDDMRKRPLSIAYVTQTFPALTQTFIYRETLALENNGFEIGTYAIWKPDQGTLSQECRHLVDRSFYVFPISWLRFIRAHLYVFLTRPARYMGTLFFVLTRRGEKTKNRFRTFFHFCEAIYLAPEMEKRHVQHIHAHFCINAASIALVLSRLLGVSFSFTAHNIFFTDRLLLKAKVQEARFIIAISEFSKNYLIRLTIGKDWDKVHIVHCGLSPEDFAPPVPKPANDVPLLLFVAQLAERKGTPVLVEACRILAGRGAAFRCVIVGDGPQRAFAEKLVEQYGLQGVIELKQAMPQEQVREYLKRTDIFVLPCITASNGDMDGIPVSLMEAMAMEIPTVSTYVSGIPELIKDGQSGLLVREKDHVALADALQRLIEDKDLRMMLGKNGRQRVLQDFNIHKNADQLAALFERYVN
jgi:glycosyltransferase involved in cell wall biosynthesis